MRGKKISVVGAGPVGIAIALALQDLGFSVTIIAKQLPGEGLTGDLAAGLGCFFKLSPPKMASFVLESYADWMSLAADAECPAVSATFLQTVTDQSDPPWASKVSGFVHPDNSHVSYITYAFDPEELGQWRLDCFKGLGGSVQHRALFADEETISYSNSTTKWLSSMVFVARAGLLVLHFLDSQPAASNNISKRISALGKCRVNNDPSDYWDAVTFCVPIVLTAS